ncbi:MAG: SAM-dependent methyltransferase, partial [Candidatus Nanohaloarchaea archaeon]
VHAPSVFTAVAETGLSLYRFGRTTTLTEQNGKVPDSVWEAVEDNREEGLHTLLLLDIGMSASKAVELLEGAFEEVLVCSRLGTPDSETVRGEPGELEVEGFEDPSSVVVPAGFSPNEKKRLESVNK